MPAIAIDDKAVRVTPSERRRQLRMALNMQKSVRIGSIDIGEVVYHI